MRLCHFNSVELKLIRRKSVNSIDYHERYKTSEEEENVHKTRCKRFANIDRVWWTNQNVSMAHTGMLCESMVRADHYRIAYTHTYTHSMSIYAVFYKINIGMAFEPIVYTISNGI